MTKFTGRFSQLNSRSIEVDNKAPTLAWNTTSTIATIGGQDITVKLPANPNTNTTYSAGTGISLSGTTFSNSGVRSIASGSSNGTISVNTNGTSANVAVKGLGSAAYTASTAYATATSLPTNYRVRAWTEVKNWGATNNFQLYTSAELGSKLGVSSATGANTFLYAIIGDASGTSWYPTWCYFSNGNWKAAMSKVASSQNSRLTYLAVYFG